MIKFLIWFLALAVLLIFEAGILTPLHLSPINLILVLVVIATLTSSFRLGLSLSLLGGVMRDFASTTPDGLMTLSLFGTFLILYFIFHSLLSREPNQITLFTSVAGATLLNLILVFAFNRLFAVFGLGTPLEPMNFLKQQVLFNLIFNLIFTYPVFQYYLWTQKLTHSKQAR